MSWVGFRSCATCWVMRTLEGSDKGKSRFSPSLQLPRCAAERWKGRFLDLNVERRVAERKIL
jgi:hypothetical protein